MLITCYEKKTLKINNINTTTLFINEYIFVDFFIFDKIIHKVVIVRFTRYVYIVNNFKTNIFLNNNILKSKNIIFFVDKNKFIINNYDDFSILLTIIVKNNERVKRIVRVQTNVFISIHFCFVISIKFCDFKLSNKNIMFDLDQINRLNK